MQSQLRDKAKHTAALIQEITEELQAIEEESSRKEQESDATQESDLEQEDSNNLLTDSEQWLCKKQEATLFANDPKILDKVFDKN